MKEIKFYKTSSGKSPVEDFLDSLSSKEAQKVTWVLSLIEEMDSISTKFYKKLSNCDEYIAKRKKSDTEFTLNFDDGYQEFKIGEMLKLARKETGLTQEDVAEAMHTKKSAISRIENHAQDIRLSTLQAFAHIMGKELKIQLV
ncbi:hypothetical protein MNB_SM-4-714 [hydrothermal vent metagenome]|uniref:HTH cro/C1-type domain-containing protein n=1 Tax=hydrothermal vent metagenome TaxID=652676 RepID=A0A1W1CPA7_9ZZZZ